MRCFKEELCLTFTEIIKLRGRCDGSMMSCVENEAGWTPVMASPYQKTSHTRSGTATQCPRSRLTRNYEKYWTMSSATEAFTSFRSWFCGFVVGVMLKEQTCRVDFSSDGKWEREPVFLFVCFFYFADVTTC